MADSDLVYVGAERARREAQTDEMVLPGVKPVSGQVQRGLSPTAF